MSSIIEFTISQDVYQVVCWKLCCLIVIAYS